MAGPQLFNYSTVVVGLSKGFYSAEGLGSLGLSSSPGVVCSLLPVPTWSGAAPWVLHPPVLALRYPGHTEPALPGGQASCGGVLHTPCLDRGVSALTDSHGDAGHLWGALGCC